MGTCFQDGSKRPPGSPQPKNEVISALTSTRCCLHLSSALQRQRRTFNADCMSSLYWGAAMTRRRSIVLYCICTYMHCLLPSIASSLLPVAYCTCSNVHVARHCDAWRHWNTIRGQSGTDGLPAKYCSDSRTIGIEIRPPPNSNSDSVFQYLYIYMEIHIHIYIYDNNYIQWTFCMY